MNLELDLGSDFVCNRPWEAPEYNTHLAGGKLWLALELGAEQNDSHSYADNFRQHQASVLHQGRREDILPSYERHPYSGPEGRV